MTTPHRSMVEGFLSVRDTLRNVSRLLLSADPILDARGFRPYTAWTVTQALARPKATEPDAWLPHFYVRQSFPKGRQGEEVVTIGVVPWTPDDDDFALPVCIGSRFEIRTVNADVSWAGVLQHGTPLPADGQVQTIDLETLGGPGWEDGDRKKLDALLASPRVLSLAVPLLDVGSSSLLETKVIQPLLAAEW